MIGSVESDMTKSNEEREPNETSWSMNSVWIAACFGATGAVTLALFGSQAAAALVAIVALAWLVLFLLNRHNVRKLADIYSEYPPGEREAALQKLSSELRADVEKYLPPGLASGTDKVPEAGGNATGRDDVIPSSVRPAPKSRSRRPRLWSAAYAIVCLLFSGLGFLAWFFDDYGIPDESLLVPMSGLATSKALGRLNRGDPTDVSFELSSSTKSVYLDSKAGGIRQLHDAVNVGDHLSVLVESACLQPTGRAQCGIWAIEINGQPFRSYASISEEWASDNRVGLWLGMGFGLGALILAWEALAANV
jgi:hypothetical protein